MINPLRFRLVSLCYILSDDNYPVDLIFQANSHVYSRIILPLFLLSFPAYTLLQSPTLSSTLFLPLVIALPLSLITISSLSLSLSFHFFLFPLSRFLFPLSLSLPLFSISPLSHYLLPFPFLYFRSLLPICGHLTSYPVPRTGPNMLIL